MTQRQQFESFYVGRYLAESLFGREYTFKQLLGYVQGERHGFSYRDPAINLEWQEFKETYGVKEMSLENTKAEAVMDFVKVIVGAYESGFVDTPKLTIGQLYQIARNHVSDEFGVQTKTLAEEMGEDFAAECNPKT